MSTIKADNISPVGSTLNLTAPVAGLSVAGGLTVGGIAFFSGGVTFNSTTDHAGVARFASGVTFNSTTDHAGVARFASTSTFTGLVTLTGGATSAAVISCGTAPTQGQHLVNKTYVDGQMIGVGQTWQQPTRSANIEYTNTTGRPIMVSLTIVTGGKFYINGNLVAVFGVISNLSFGYAVIIPNGATYQFSTNTGGAAGSIGGGGWWELR